MPAGWPRKVQPIRRGRCRREPAPSFATTTIMTAMIPLDQGVSKFGESAGAPVLLQREPGALAASVLRPVIPIRFGD